MQLNTHLMATLTPYRFANCVEIYFGYTHQGRILSHVIMVLLMSVICFLLLPLYLQVRVQELEAFLSDLTPLLLGCSDFPL